MRLKVLSAALLLSCFFGVTGCARTVAFDVAVRNDTAEPVTLALTKSGPPFERLWAAPEDLAIESPDADEQHGYVVLPPTREARVTLKGKFGRGSRGYLRVYRGDLQISDMNAINPVSPNRVDLPLRPGPNRFEIVDVNGRLTGNEVAAAAATPAP